MSDNTITFYEPVRPGDRITSAQLLRSVSEDEDDAGSAPGGSG